MAQAKKESEGHLGIVEQLTQQRAS